jgi:uncharacterized membrane protein YhaH (DUF805 family)
MSGFLSRRMGRRDFWLLVLGNIILASALRLLAIFALRHAGKSALSDFHNPLWILVTSPTWQPLFYFPSYVAAIWRLHDTGRSGTWAWVAFICNLAFLAFLAGAGIGAAELYMHSPHANIGASEFVALLGGFGGALIPRGILMWLAYLCAQPGDGGQNWHEPPADDPPATGSEPIVMAPASPPTRSHASRAPRAFGRRA